MLTTILMLTTKQQKQYNQQTCKAGEFGFLAFKSKSVILRTCNDKQCNQIDMMTFGLINLKARRVLTCVQMLQTK